MKTFTTVAVVASFLAVAPAYAHSHMSTSFQEGNGDSSMGQISQGGNGTHTGNMTDRGHDHDDRWTRDTDKVTDRHTGHDGKGSQALEMKLEMEAAELVSRKEKLQQDLVNGVGNPNRIKQEIQRLTMELTRLDQKIVRIYVRNDL